MSTIEDKISEIFTVVKDDGKITTIDINGKRICVKGVGTYFVENGFPLGEAAKILHEAGVCRKIIQKHSQRYRSSRNSNKDKESWRQGVKRRRGRIPKRSVIHIKET